MKHFLLIAAAALCIVVARPVAIAQDSPINGKWHFVLDTPGGDREVDCDFTVGQDGKVTGKWADTDVAGTYKEGQLDLNFQFTSDEAGETAAMKIAGKLDQSIAALVGTWEFSSYSGTFKATRPAPPAAPAAPAGQSPQ